MGSVISFIGGLVVACPIAIVGGAILLVVGVGYGTYRLIKYCQKTESIYESKDLTISQTPERPITLEDLQKIAPDWKKLNCSEEDLKEVKSLTKRLFQKKIQIYTCPITSLVTREPARVKCCKRVFEAMSITLWVSDRNNCPICRQPLTEKDICKDPEDDCLIERMDAIKWFRMEIRKTFRSLSAFSEDKTWWEENINMHMGIGYTQNDL